MLYSSTPGAPFFRRKRALASFCDGSPVCYSLARLRKNGVWRRHRWCPVGPEPKALLTYSESFIWENTMRAADAVAPNLAPPTEERCPVRKTKPLYQWKYRRRRRGAPPCRHADCRLQWRFLHFRACARPRILERDDIWRIGRLLTQKLYRNGCMHFRYSDSPGRDMGAIDGLLTQEPPPGILM